MGLRAIQNGVMSFTDVKVPVENVLWGEGRGLKLALRTLNTGRLTLPAACTGIAKQCLGFARRWGTEREQWGQAIGRHEAGRDKIAFIASSAYAMEAVTWLTSHWADEGRDIRIEAAMAKLFCSELSWRVLDTTLQFRGGRGYERATSLRARGESAYPIERMMRDGRINTIIEGTTDIMRLFLAREALDPHLKIGLDLMRPGATPGERIACGLRMARFYGAWYPRRVIGRFLPSRFPGRGPLLRHGRFINRASHRLAASLFGAMARHREKLEREQVVLAHHLPPGPRAACLPLEVAAKRLGTTGIESSRRPGTRRQASVARERHHPDRRRCPFQRRTGLIRMNLRTYRTTGRIITAVRRLLDVELEVTGLENLSSRPTLFAANHFTRLETLLIPYVLYTYAERRTVNSLANPLVFRGLLGRYLEACGVMSTRHPRRNLTIVRDLMTGEHDWVIYPEGGIIKNKKTVRGKQLHLEHPRRQGPPHTGAAMLTLKAAMARRRYTTAVERSDTDHVSFYEDRYELNGVDTLAATPPVLVPMNITFYPLRPGRNPLSRAAHFLSKGIDPRLLEELQVEGAVLFRDCRISVHFAEPLEVEEYLDLPTSIARRVVGLVSRRPQGDLGLRRQAVRLTGACMRRLYASTEVNFDHLLCYALQARRSDRISVVDLRKALYLTAAALRRRDDVRVHKTLRNGIVALLTNDPHQPLEMAVDLACRQGVLRRDGDTYLIDQDALHRDHDWHSVRLDNTVRVLANEVEPVRPAVQTISRAINLPSADLAAEIEQAVHEGDQVTFDRNYDTWFRPQVSKPMELGKPFFLPGTPGGTGVVLAHGYLACPEQMRPLAERLNAAGCSVYGVCLDGHGTSPEALTSATWRSWMTSVRKGFATVQQRSDTIVAGGFSLGGILALLLAGRRPQDVSGVFAINPPFRIQHRLAFMIPTVDEIARATRLLRLGDGRFRRPGHVTETPDHNYEQDYICGVRELRRAVRR
jgi:pimeloyl-ACP methyl ester carboxylesterase/1-acyl-sn-glycerol-3-phosphate acyltransferase